jgi:exopolysaccharide biosynthesis polyprenyl glycosylphosphotransferase
VSFHAHFYLIQKQKPLRVSVMNTARRKLLMAGSKILYPGLMTLALILATVFVVAKQEGGITLAEFFAIRVRLWNFLVIAMLLMAWHGIFSLCGFYRSKRLASQRALIMDAVSATSQGTVMLALAAKAFHITMVHLNLIMVFWIVSSALVIGARVALRYLLGNIRRRGHNLRHVLVLGTNSRALEFARRVESNPELGYRVVGFVDDEWDGLEAFHQHTYELCSSSAGLFDYLRHNVVDEVAIFLPLRSFYEHIAKVVTVCEHHGIVLRFDTDIFNLKLGRSYLNDVEDGSHVSVYGGALHGWPVLIKRVLDVAISSLLLFLLAPSLTIVALLIKFTCGGPILFKQERVGLNKRRFLIYKFRTMVPNADAQMAELEKLNEVSGPVFKIKNDPRMTPIGRFLRRASIDELPQLFNVLKGDMSLVGPRPLPVRDYQGFSEDWQRRRFSIRPGITCLWQVNGRSAISFEKWMQLDLQYVDEWSLWLDIKILARTVPAVLKGSGAA